MSRRPLTGRPFKRPVTSSGDFDINVYIGFESICV
jgi:hypothetical protein